MLSIFSPLTLHLLLQLANATPNELDSHPQNHVTNPTYNNTKSPLSFQELTKLNNNGFNAQKPINNAIFPFLTELKNNDGFDSQNETDCWWRPYMCREGLPPIVPILCCNNRCVNVRRSRDNCGLCGVRCPFGWKCCHGVCIDVMISPFHCGDCNRRCRFPSLCLDGTCCPKGSKPPKIPIPKTPETPKPPCHAKPPCTSPPKRPKPPCSKPPSPLPPKCTKPPFASPPEHVKPPCASPPRHPKPPYAPPPEHVKPPCASPPKHATPPYAPSPMDDDEE